MILVVLNICSKYFIILLSFWNLECNMFKLKCSSSCSSRIELMLSRLLTFSMNLMFLGKIMKLDFSGLESSAPLYGGNDNLLSDGFSDAPSFDLPVTSDVSFFTLFYPWIHASSCFSLKKWVNVYAKHYLNFLASVWWIPEEFYPNGKASKRNNNLGFYFQGWCDGCGWFLS